MNGSNLLVIVKSTHISLCETVNSFLSPSISEKYWLCLLAAVFNKWFIFKNSFSLLQSTLEVTVLFMLNTVGGLCLLWMLQTDTAGWAAVWNHVPCALRDPRFSPCADKTSSRNVALLCINRTEWKNRTQLLCDDYVPPKFTGWGPDSQPLSVELYLERRVLKGVIKLSCGPQGGP